MRIKYIDRKYDETYFIHSVDWGGTDGVLLRGQGQL